MIEWQRINHRTRKAIKTNIAIGVVFVALALAVCVGFGYCFRTI